MHDNQRSDRRSRSGSRHRSNHGHGNKRGGRDSYYSAAPARPQPPVKLTFWQKVASFFTGTKPAASASRSGSASSHRAERHASNGDRRTATESGSQNGHRRFESGPSAAPRQARKPELVEVSSPKIYVGNLSFDATEGDLYELFNGVGKVQNAEIVSNKYTQKSKGFAFVTMLTVDEARRAVTELHDKEFMGRKLVVSGAKTSENRDSRDSQPIAARHEEAPQEDAPAAPAAP